MSDRGLGEKPLAQWTMTTRSSNTTTTKGGDYGYSTEISSLSSAKPGKAGLFSRLGKAPSRKCTLPNAHKHGWKPETMKAPVLVTFATASLLLAILLEVLAHQSQKAGGLSLVKDADSFSSLVTFGYLYLPTVIAVIYSLAWNWVDLDVKRMQPWLELSREGGATGKNSLFLDYPFDFVAFVPLKAAKRKHWAVFYSGTIMTLVFFLITPLQSAVLGTGEVLVKKPTTLIQSKEFMNPLSQAAQLDLVVFNTGYAITWLKQPYPAFTTADYALMPFKPQQVSQDLGTPANWTGVTTKYWTDLECWDAEKTLMWDEGPYAFFDGRSCNTSSIVAYGGLKPYRMQYIGWQNSAHADYSLGAPSCGKEAFNEFLAVWSYHKEGERSVDIGAKFCETSYFKQNVTASVRAGDFAPIPGSISPLGEPEKLIDAEFNSSAFQFLLGAGFSSVIIPRDYPFSHLMEQYPRLNNSGLTYPLSPLIGFAVGLQNFSVAEYRNGTVMDLAFKAAHRSLFSVAMQHVLVNRTSPLPYDGEVHYTRYGIIVSRPFSIVLEIGLIVIAAMTLMLCWECYRSACMLSEDPGSLASLMNVVRSSDKLLTEFLGKDTLTDEQLAREVGSYKFILKCGCLSQAGAASIDVLETSFLKAFEEGVNLEHSRHKGSGHYNPIKPVALHKGIGTIFLLFLAAGIAVLAVLKAREQELGGLIPPSSSFEVNLILTSFLPTAFSTLVEPFWVLLNRLLCILQPFQDLWVKPKSADRSMQARYTAVPPPLAIWRAVKSGHYLLVGVCFVALLANVLAVGLGGLFNEAPARITYKVPILAMKNAALTAEGLEDFRRNIVYAIASDYADPFYVAMANLSYGTPFLPWTDAEFFYLPVGISGQNSSKDTYTAKTIGVGVEPLCLAAGPIISVDEPPGIPTESREGGTREGCPPTYYPSSLNMNTSNYAVPDGPAAVELVETVTSSPNITECDMSLVVGWSRANIQNKTGSMNTSLIVCRPQFKTAEFNITFDSQGYIQNTTALSNFSSTLPYPDFALHEKAILNHFNHKLQHRDLQWHNDTVSREWFHYLLMVYTGNRDILDARAPLPDPEIMVPSVTSVYKMLFTVFLALNQYVFEDNDGQGTDTALGYTTEPRIFVSTPALIVSLTILAFNIIMAIVFYGWGIKLFLPRMPTTIGSLLAYIAPSKAVREYSAGKLENSKSFKFGRFVGEDGKAHIGIDYSEKVVPLKLSSLERGDTMPATSKFGRLWHRSRTGRQGETWL